MDAFQRFLNRLTGVSDESWEAYGPGERERRKRKDERIQAISLKIDALAGRVNELLSMIPGENVRQADIQKSINKMMGISDETWEKYN